MDVNKVLQPTKYNAVNINLSEIVAKKENDKLMRSNKRREIACGEPYVKMASRIWFRHET